jgi:hypothetical protein
METVNSNQHIKAQASTDGRLQQTKYDTIRSLGFADPEKTAHRFESMAAHCPGRRSGTGSPGRHQYSTP